MCGERVLLLCARMCMKYIYLCFGILLLGVVSELDLLLNGHLLGLDTRSPQVDGEADELRVLLNQSL